MIGRLIKSIGAAPCETSGRLRYLAPVRLLRIRLLYVPVEIVVPGRDNAMRDLPGSGLGQQAGTGLDMELTVDHQRKNVRVAVTKLPFFDPPRKRA